MYYLRVGTYINIKYESLFGWNRRIAHHAPTRVHIFEQHALGVYTLCFFEDRDLLSFGAQCRLAVPIDTLPNPLRYPLLMEEDAIHKSIELELLEMPLVVALNFILLLLLVPAVQLLLALAHHCLAEVVLLLLLHSAHELSRPLCQKLLLAQLPLGQLVVMRLRLY